MLTEDYVMRMINQAMAVLVKIIGLKKAGDNLEALQAVDQGLEILLGLRIDLIRGMEEEGLIAALSPQGKLDIPRTALVAELYRQQGEIYEARSQSQESKESYLRSLNLYLETALTEAAEKPDDLSEKISYLTKKLPEGSLPPDTIFALSIYDEQNEHYASANHWLSTLRAHPEVEEEILPEYLEFCERMIAKTDDDLARGGLTRGQVLALQAHLSRMA